MRSLKFAGSRFWNSLPTNITNLNLLKLFCKALNLLIIYLSVKKYFFIKKKGGYVLLFCVWLCFGGSSARLAFAISMIPTRILSSDYNFYSSLCKCICLFFFVYLNHIYRELSEMNLLVLSCKQWLIKCPFFRDELYFHPFSGLFINPFAPGDFVKNAFWS